MESRGFSVRSNGIFGFIFLLLLLVGLFFLAKGIFTILLWLSPFLIVGSLILNYKTILNYFKFIISLLHRNTLAGIIVIILSVVAFPVLSGILFGKAIIDRKVRRLQRAHEAGEASEYVDYEEVIKPGRKEDLELPPLDKSQAQKKENRYENLF